MTDFQTEKALVRAHYANLAKATPATVEAVLAEHTSADWHWRGMHPFDEQHGAADVAEVFWKPFLTAFTPLQRRTDIFFSSTNSIDNGKSEWVCSMGNFLGLFDKDWLDIPATGKICNLRFAEFNRIENGKIAETALFCDILSVMHQAGVYPLGPSTGEMFVYPGPRTHDGLLYEDQDVSQGAETLALVDRMIDDLSQLNLSDEQRVPPEFLARCWHDDMIWYGPFGIGATYTIERYQEQHQFPFRLGLADKTFNGHIARFAEGNYAGFFGWPNLSNRPTGGFMGLTSSQAPADMRVVDVYRRDGDKLAENWVFIDMLHYLNMQGLDVLKRMRQIRRVEPV